MQSASYMCTCVRTYKLFIWRYTWSCIFRHFITHVHCTGYMSSCCIARCQGCLIIIIDHISKETRAVALTFQSSVSYGNTKQGNGNLQVCLRCIPSFSLLVIRDIHVHAINGRKAEFTYGRSIKHWHVSALFGWNGNKINVVIPFLLV